MEICTREGYHKLHNQDAKQLFQHLLQGICRIILQFLHGYCDEQSNSGGESDATPDVLIQRMDLTRASTKQAGT